MKTQRENSGPAPCERRVLSCAQTLVLLTLVLLSQPALLFAQPQSDAPPAVDNSPQAEPGEQPSQPPNLEPTPPATPPALPATPPALPATQPAPPSNTSELPWARKQNKTDALPATGITSARQLLINVDDSELSRLIDRQPLETDDEEILHKILYRWPAFHLDDVERFQKTDVTWQQLVDDPQAHRVEILRLTGRVKQVDKQQLLPETASRLEYNHYFRVELELDGAPNPVLVCSRIVPKAWKVGEPIDERVSCFGLFIKVGDSSGPAAQLVFAANRVAWHPDRVEPSLGITADHVLLGDLGMDIGLFDDVRNRTHGITANDRECFYQMLAVTGRSQKPDWESHAQQQIDLASVLNDPQVQQGKLMTVSGVARRITKIEVPDRDIQQRFGIDHYYQLDVFVALPRDLKGIRMVDARGDSAGVEFTNNFPVNICVLRLPESLAKRPKLSEGEFLSERIILPAAFFKLWAYKTEYVSQVDSEQYQFGPLLIGLEPELDTIDTGMNPYVGIAAGAVFLIALAAIWIGLWRYNRGDAKFDREVLKRQMGLESGQSLDEMGIESQDGPDFSKLD
jgi:hypothetical protein